jgi:cobalt-zinc-cadmium efflux system protein
VAAGVLVEAVRRLTGEVHVESGTMLAVALLGLAANTIALVLLHRAQTASLNLRGAYLEVLGDLLGSAAVVVAAIVIAVTGLDAADVVASLLVAALIVPRAVALARAAVDILLESAPRGMDLALIRAHIVGLDRVVDVHDLHAWTLGTGVPVLSAHVVVEDTCFRDGSAPRLLDQLQSCLLGHFDVEHSTFQLEAAGHDEHEGRTHP